MTEHNEQRHFTRIPFDAEANIECGNRQWRSQLLDISLRGALLNRPADWQGQLGDRCRLALHLADSAVEIDMDAEVAHLEDDHIGFHCLHIDLDSVTHLRRLVELNLGDQALLERELAELLAHP